MSAPKSGKSASKIANNVARNRRALERQKSASSAVEPTEDLLHAKRVNEKTRALYNAAADAFEAKYEVNRSSPKTALDHFLNLDLVAAWLSGLEAAPIRVVYYAVKWR